MRTKFAKVKATTSVREKTKATTKCKKTEKMRATSEREKMKVNVRKKINTNITMKYSAIEKGKKFFLNILCWL